MSDHEFEKQVRQKLDDLRLTPTAGAWENIQQGIGKSRRRRAPIFWLPLLLIGVGAAGYLAFKMSAFNPDQPTLATTETGSTPAHENLSAQPVKPPVVLPAEKTQTTLRPSASKSIAGKSTHSPSATVPVQQPTADTRLSVNSEEELKTQDSDVPSLRDPGVSKNFTAVPELYTSAIRLHSENPFSVDDVSRLVVPFVPVSPAPSSAATPPLLIRKKKWSYGVSGFAGMSGLNKGDLFDLSKAMTADMQRPANAAFAPSFTPYRIVADVSFAAGLTVKRELSKRFHLSSGLNYLQISSRHKVGDQVYGSQTLNAIPFGQYVRNYFMVELHQPKDYRNVYQFAEIPLMVHTRLNQSNKLPIYWNVGGSYSYLIKSNSKQFDGSTGVYYSNEKQVNKSQIAAATGFDFVLFGKTSHPLWIGPIARYSITRHINNDAGDQANFLSAGVNMKLFLK